MIWISDLFTPQKKPLDQFWVLHAARGEERLLAEWVWLRTKRATPEPELSKGWLGSTLGYATTVPILSSGAQNMFTKSIVLLFAMTYHKLKLLLLQNEMIE